MVLYQCDRCNYLTSNCVDYKRHQNRKFPCKKNNMKPQNGNNVDYNENVGIFAPPQHSHSTLTALSQHFGAPNCTELSLNTEHNEITFLQNTNPISSMKTDKQIICQWCKCIFSRISSLKRHFKICQIKLEQDIKNKNYLKELEIKYNELKAERDQLKDELKDAQSTTTTTTNNVINDNRKFTNIQINTFGNENLDFINEKLIKKLLTGYPNEIIPKLIASIHCNPEHIENMNVYVQNKKEPYVMISENGKWILSSKKGVTQKLIDKGQMIFDSKTYDMIFNKSETKKIDKFSYMEDEKYDIESLNIGLLNNKHTLSKIGLI